MFTNISINSFFSSLFSVFEDYPFRIRQILTANLAFMESNSIPSVKSLYDIVVDSARQWDGIQRKGWNKRKEGSEKELDKSEENQTRRKAVKETLKK